MKQSLLRYKRKILREIPRHIRTKMTHRLTGIYVRHGRPVNIVGATFE